MKRFAIILAVLCSVPSLLAQQQAGEVVGTMSGVLHKYHGEFTDDMFGPGGSLSLHYAPLDRLAIETRFGVGELRWKVSPSSLANYPAYFGAGAGIGDLYPGTTSTIEAENETSITTFDLILQYALVPNLDAVPFISAGVGYISYSPTNAGEHEPLPNNIADVYTGSAISFPVGGGVRIPFSDRVGMVIRGEYRFVLSDYLDDLSANGSNDAITSVSFGLTYTFTERERVLEWVDDWIGAGDYTEVDYDEVDYDEVDYDEVDYDEVDYDEVDYDEVDYCCADYDCVDDCCVDECCCYCCCCCCCKDGGGGSGDGGGGAAPAPAPAAEPAPPEAPEPAPARKAFSKDIRFKLDTDEFDFKQPQTSTNLQELLTYMKEAPEGHEVIIEGHASGEGPPVRNKVLSDLRSKKIRQWLIEQGVEPEKIRGTVGYGSSMPRVTEPSPEEAKRMSKEEVENLRAQNRRIEVHVLKDGYEQGAGS